MSALCLMLVPSSETTRSVDVQLDCLTVRSWDPHHTFCCRGPLSNSRPVVGSSAQTTRGDVLDSLYHQKMLSFNPFSRFLFFVSVSYLLSINVGIGDVSSHRCFSQSAAYCERTSSAATTCIEKNRPMTQLSRAYARARCY